VECPGVDGYRGGGCVVIGNDGGGDKEMVRSPDGRSFQRRHRQNWVFGKQIFSTFFH